ncbi:hypothetical protein Emag_002546 [Eimeria magna]
MRSRRSSSRSSHSSTDLLLLYLLLFKELRWGEAIQARVRRQVTQLQGFLLSLQRLESEASPDTKTGGSRGCTLSLKDLKELSFGLEESDRLDDSSATAEREANPTPEECCTLLRQ